MLTMLMLGAALAAEPDVPDALDLTPDTASVVAVDFLLGFGSGSFVAGQPARGALDLTLQGGWLATYLVWRGRLEQRFANSMAAGDFAVWQEVRGEAWAFIGTATLLRTMDMVRTVRSAEKSKRQRWEEAYGVDAYRVPTGPSRAEMEQQTARVVLLVLEADVPEGSESWFDLIVAVGQAMNQGHDGVSIRDAALRGRELQPDCLPGECVRAGLPE